MADVERLDVSEHKDALPEELSRYDALVRGTESPRTLYGEDSEGNKTRITDLGAVVLHFAAMATGEEVKRVSDATETAPKKEEKVTAAGIDIEALVNRMVEERVRQALAGRDEREKEMQKEIDVLKKEIERLQKPLNQRLDEDFGENWVPREEGVAVARRNPDGYLDEGWATDGQPYEKEGKWFIKVKKDDNAEEAELPTLIRVKETQVDETDDTEPAPKGMPEGSRQVYRRRGWLARQWDWARRRPVRERVPTGVYAAPDGGYITRVDEEIVEVPPSEVEARDGTARTIGAVALIGVGALAIWELVEHKYMGHSPSRELRHSGVWPWGHIKGAPNPHHVTGPDVTGGHGLGNGTHTDWYNTAGPRRTGVEASSTIHLVGQPGNEHLVDGHKVLLDGKKVEWDSQGKLSWWDRVKLRKEGYDIGWGRIQDKLRHGYRMKTIITKP